MWKKLLTLVCLLLCVCRSVPSAAAVQEDTETRLLNDLIILLQREEQIQGDMLRTLDAIGDFDREKNWSSLLTARAILSVAKRHVETRTPPETAITVNDEMILLDAGIDVSFMERAGSVFLADREMLMSLFSSLRYSLVLDVFFLNDWEIAMQHARLCREIVEMQLQYYANLADWTLAKIGHPEASETFNRLLAEHCPLIHARQAASPVSVTENEEASDALLGKMEELILEDNMITGARKDRHNRLIEMMESGDWKSIGGDLQPLSGMPALLLIPPRFEMAEERYYWTENGEILDTQRPDTVPDRLPEYCRVRIDGVSRKEAEAYQQTMEKAGISPVSQKEEDGALFLLYRYDNTSFSVEWQDDTMTFLMVDDPLCFVPIWYLLARNAAD